MTRNELYLLEIEASKNIEHIKREQAEYVRGIEKGIDIMFRTVKNYILQCEEKERTEREKKE